MSLIAAFIPLLFMPGFIGKLFREFALTAAAAIVISAAVSLTLGPTLAALFMKSGGHTAQARLGAAAPLRPRAHLGAAHQRATLAYSARPSSSP